ncbi:hypothetical protein [Vibrio sp. CUB2]|nr:hypothetical protein [Vibrio sp. CUB2]
MPKLRYKTTNWKQYNKASELDRNRFSDLAITTTWYSIGKNNL